MGGGGSPHGASGDEGNFPPGFLVNKAGQSYFSFSSSAYSSQFRATLGDPGYMVESAESKTGDIKAKRTGKNEQESYNERQIKVAETLLSLIVVLVNFHSHKFSPF